MSDPTPPPELTPTQNAAATGCGLAIAGILTLFVIIPFFVFIFWLVTRR